MQTDEMGKNKDKSTSTSQDRSNTINRNADPSELNYYNLQPSTSTDHRYYSYEGQGWNPGQEQGHPRPPGHLEGDTTSSSSSTSSLSSSTTAFNDDNISGQLALVPRAPPFQLYAVGMPPGGFSTPYYLAPEGGSPPAVPPGSMMSGQVMLPSVPVGCAGEGGAGGGGPAGGTGPPPRYLPPIERSEEKMQRPYYARAPASPFIMEHPSLRQLVIFMALLFLLALVALVLISIYFGRTTETHWKI